MKSTQKTNKNKYIYILILLFKLSCDVAYYFAVSPTFDYMRYYISFNALKLLVGWAAVLVMSLRFNRLYTNGKINFSTAILFLLYLLSYIPSMTLVGFMDLDWIYFLLLNAYWGLMVLLEYVFCAKKAKKRVAFTEIQPALPVFSTVELDKTNLLNFKTALIQKRHIILAISVITIIMTLYFSYRYVGLRINLNLLEAYDLRYGDIRGLDGVFQYLYIWVGVVLALLTARSFFKKKYLLFLILLFSMMIYYSIEGSRTLFFIIPLAIIACYIYNKGKFNIILLGFIFLNVVTVLEAQYISGTKFFTGYWGMRTLFTPPMLSSVYYDFFSTNPLDYLAQGVMRYFGVKSYYDVSIKNLLNVLYFGGDISGSVNTGLFGEAYSNFGAWSVIIYPVFMLGIFKYINFFSKGLPINENFLFIIYYVQAFLNASPFTVLLTNGLLIVTLLLSQIKKESELERRIKDFKRSYAKKIRAPA